MQLDAMKYPFRIERLARQFRNRKEDVRLAKEEYAKTEFLREIVGKDSVFLLCTPVMITAKQPHNLLRLST
jgi:hypothetical protein